MDIWILNNKTGLNVFYKSFSRINVESDLISGLLSAFNQFTMAEFKQPVESLEIGGLRWIYIVVPDLDLLFVAADSKEIPAKQLRDRLDTIKDSFIKQYAEVWKKKLEFWDGDLTVFESFHQRLEDIYFQWEETEIVNQLADFFDFLGVNQQVFNLLRSAINNLSEEKIKENLNDSIEQIFSEMKNREEFQSHHEIQKISFSKKEGFKIINVNAANCDPVLTKTLLTQLIEAIANEFKELFGIDQSIKHFRDGKIFSYILSNTILLRELNLEKHLLRTFLYI